MLVWGKRHGATFSLFPWKHVIKKHQDSPQFSFLNYKHFWHIMKDFPASLNYRWRGGGQVWNLPPEPPSLVWPVKRSALYQVFVYAAVECDSRNYSKILHLPSKFRILFFLFFGGHRYRSCDISPLSLDLSLPISPECRTSDGRFEAARVEGRHEGSQWFLTKMFSFFCPTALADGGGLFNIWQCWSFL